jgi:ring-1,2-phenylacetyl-CoA epoxidase subunit PaaC
MTRTMSTCSKALLLSPHHLTYVLRLADGALILAQRIAEWCGHGPVVEEDIAFTNIALDLLGQARLLYTHAGQLEGTGRDEDAFAYWRDAEHFYNPSLVELPNGDFGQSVLRAYAYTAYQQCLWPTLEHSQDLELAAIARKSHPETDYHCDHLAQWILRLGDGTAESHARMQRALEIVWPYTPELFGDDAVEQAAVQSGLGPASSTLLVEWRQRTSALLAKATLELPASTPCLATGRQGQHTQDFRDLLAEMQSLARAHPGAQW